MNIYDGSALTPPPPPLSSASDLSVKLDARAKQILILADWGISVKKTTVTKMYLPQWPGIYSEANRWNFPIILNYFVGIIRHTIWQYLHVYRC